MLLPPYLAQHWLSFLWQLELEYMLEDVLEFSLYHCYFFHIFTNTNFKHVTSTYYDSWYLVFEFIFNVTYFHRVVGISCMRSYLVSQTLKIMFCVVLVQGDPKLVDDDGEIPKSQERGGQFDSRLWNLLSMWQKTCQATICLLRFGASLSAICLKIIIK